MLNEFDIYFNDETFTDINPLFAGGQKCEKKHSFGPRICPYTIIHYVLSGKGTLEKNGTVYEVKEGEMFIIFEDEIAKYTADCEDPWEYIWIAYDGIYSKKLKSAEIPVLKAKNNDFNKFREKCINQLCDKYYTASFLFNLHSTYLTKSGSTLLHDYPAEVKKIIQLKYMQSISVEQIANMLNIDKRYMSRIFKKKYGKTVIEYIINLRIAKACELLRQGYSVADTAIIVGYTDSFNFSKMFSKKMGLPPKEYRKTHITV